MLHCVIAVLFGVVMNEVVDRILNSYELMRPLLSALPIRGKKLADISKAWRLLGSATLGSWWNMDWLI